MLERVQIRAILRLAYARGLGADVAALLLDLVRNTAANAEEFVFGCELVLDVLREVEEEAAPSELSDKSD